MSDTKNASEKFQFKAEVKQLLDILVHSLYTSREIFLRELISNASDALDKLRFESTKGTKIIDSDLPYEIKVEFDEKGKILKIIDTGIGMSKSELISNIGTIAKSGTSEFLKTIQASKEDAGNIIGRFGVGFYSVFMVANQVVIRSKSFKEENPAIEWKSDGLGDYEIKELDTPLKRGTSIEVHLKEDSSEFAEKYRLESIIKKHSSFISFPIYLENERMNNITALWRESKSSITKEKYSEFYKFLTYESDEPMDIIHKSVDAPIQFNSLLFIPSKNYDYFWFNKENYGLDLYVRRVLIQHKNKDLLPEYLSFVKGVVDSEDLPLNISRETLQDNSIFRKIASSVTGQVLSYLAEKATNEPEKYAEFWKEHGKIFKMGYSDFVNMDKYMELLRFNSSHLKSKDELTSLADYASRMRDGQKEIYYITGNNREAMELDPHLEIFKSKDLEVLYFYDPVDEFVFNSLRKYKDFEFKAVDSVEFKNLDKFKDVAEKEEPKEKLSKDDAKQFDSLLSKMKSILGDKVTDVKESKRLKGSPSCLVSAEDGLTASMHKILKMTSKDTAPQKKVFEVNKDNALIRNLIEIFKKSPDDDYIKNTTEQLYEAALLLEGNLDDPHNLVARMNKIMEMSSQLYKESVK